VDTVGKYFVTWDHAEESYDLCVSSGIKRIEDQAIAGPIRSTYIPSGMEYIGAGNTYGILRTADIEITEAYANPKYERIVFGYSNYKTYEQENQVIEYKSDGTFSTVLRIMRTDAVSERDILYVPETLGGFTVNAIADYILDGEAAMIHVPDSVSTVSQNAMVGGLWLFESATEMDSVSGQKCIYNVKSIRTSEMFEEDALSQKYIFATDNEGNITILDYYSSTEKEILVFEKKMAFAGVLYNVKAILYTAFLYASPEYVFYEDGIDIIGYSYDYFHKFSDN